MKISARNVFNGSIRHIEPGAVNDEVTVAIAGGQELTAIVTSGSVKSLGLAVGKPVVALVKASSVLVLVDGEGLRLSARNNLAGTVAEIREGAVEAEVSIALSGGASVHAVITKESVHSLGLKPGVRATTIIKASSVILGVSD